MPNPLAESARFYRQWQRGIAWRDNVQSFVLMPVTAALAAWGAGIAVAALFWFASGAQPALFLGLLLLTVPALCGVFLTYHFDLLEIGLGWRVVDLGLQLSLAVLLSIALADSTGLVGAAAAVVAAWVVGIRIGSDLVPFRSDKVAGYPKVKARLEAAKHGLDQNLFASLLILGLLFALEGTILPPLGYAGTWVAGVGAVALLGAVMEIQAGVGHMIRRAGVDLETEVVLVDTMPLLRFWVHRALAAALLAGLLLPSGISPFAHRSFKGIGDSVTTKLGPLFVLGPKLKSVFQFRWPWVDAEDLAAGALPYWISVLLLLLLIVLVVFTMRAFWRMWRSDARRERIAGEYDSFWLSLWRAILRWFSHRQEAMRRWFIPSDGQLVRNRALVTRRRERTTRPTEPGALIRWLFARLLRQARTYGQARLAHETAAEYGLRLMENMVVENGTALKSFVDLYEGARYGRSPIGAAMAATAVSLWRGAWRGLRRLSR